MTTAQQVNAVQPMLTDLYQISMAYAYWKNGKHQDKSTFDLFFRKNPFGGEYALFAGLEDCLKFIESYKFQKSDIEYLQQVMPDYIEEEFFEFLLNINMNDIKIYAIPEGSVSFPRVPLLRIEGPILKAQLLETTLLTLINYASLVATNAARFRAAVDPNKKFYELGLRRAQGPDGGLSASKYCYLGGFDGTSNVLAGKLYGIPIRGTHAHAYINSYQNLEELKIKELTDRITGESRPFVQLCLKYLDELGPILKIFPDQTHKGELAAFIAYAIAFPSGFLALVDTYDVLKSGVPNFLAVALALHECQYEAVGLRLDSGDISYLSLEVRAKFIEMAQKFNLPFIEHLTIVASNDINEDTLHSLEKQGHAVDIFGIGTHLVTCQRQPALGCVYKLVELNGIPRIKVSQDIEKVTIPGRKNLYRLYDSNGKALCDLMTKTDEPEPIAGERVLCRHPFFATKRAYVTPTSVQCMYKLYWANGQIQHALPTWHEVRTFAQQQIETLRKDHRRNLNPTPYKVSVSDSLHLFLHKLWMSSVPIGELA
ncbi:unnamed protein product [Rotaria magnacalcarata]|uniref:Nicotinate phosphoribosyltransferase n=1 Tax=Rotaria magnacalcarata TaxID=392030 RepID=A0A816EFG4_9BILA|nr:unnamed protein product [Rotaria magnacalcarata]CAF1649193.1 unnamed protein product [Rotaria magnacalcarata]CAF2049686.1 unnamed protein product [Rotaria magnacalcarata]CAF3866038.1 unnamed protein product [Rotaria magnacalcarata]CAF3900584.1 unnamed protein product [Rotaria magnacalcarata]